MHDITAFAASLYYNLRFSETNFLKKKKKNSFKLKFLVYIFLKFFGDKNK